MSIALLPEQMTRLSTFIRTNTDQIISEWETFAAALPMGDTMDIEALRDHAREMLEVIADDLDMPQTRREAFDKSGGKSDAGGDATPTAAQQHGAQRAESGFSVQQMVSEFRALRASVVRLWTRQPHDTSATAFDDMTRFNEAIDQAIAESITRYTDNVAQSKDRFIAILGHDLRTPLGAIITSTRFMLDTGELAEPHLTLVTRIDSSARRMNQMVVDLLDFTRTRFGDGIPVVRTESDMRKLVHDVVSEVSASYPGSTIQVETSGELRGQWDCHRLTQALTNLIDNAVHHGLVGSPIMVAARGARDDVVLSVHNEGPAIPKERLGHIFDAMTQAGNGSRAGNHLGLGLYIVQQIVTAHGGSIDVSSTREEGTTFTVHLPRQA